MTKWWTPHFGFEGGNHVFDKNVSKTLERKSNNGEDKWRWVEGFAEWDEAMPLGGDSKISKEDPSLWIRDSIIKINGSKKNLEKLRAIFKFSFTQNLSTNVSNKGLYTMGLNTKSLTWLKAR